jgi:hypothetical protein
MLSITMGGKTNGFAVHCEQKETGAKARVGVEAVGGDGKVDRFMELKAIMMERLQNIRAVWKCLELNGGDTFDKTFAGQCGTAHGASTTS